MEQVKAWVDAKFQDRTKYGSFNGAVLLASAGQVILSSGYGFADRDQKTPNTPQTKFLIGSMTRAFTAMGIMILQERGKLNVQDKLCQYLQDCPPAWQPVTLHQMLASSSGIPDASEASYTSTLTSTLPLIAEAKAMPVVFPAGTDFSFSYMDYYLLGQVIEIVSGQSYEDFLQANIFTPLGMSDTGLAHNLDGLAIGYANRTSTVADNQFLFAGDADDGLYSTVEDLYRWDQALNSEILVSQKSLDAIYTTHTPSPVIGAGTSYGYGWILFTEAGKNWVFHPAWSKPGFLTEIYRLPSDEIVIIILSNQWDANVHGTAFEIIDILIRRYLTP